jgi:hypothetical protein
MLKAVELLAARGRLTLPDRIGVPFGPEWYLPGKSSIYGKGGAWLCGRDE